jgi:hypothetical protein
MHFEVWATPRGLLFGHSGERVENALGTSWEQFGNDLRMLREHSRMHWEPTENALGTFWERIGNAEAIGLMFFIIIILQKKYNSILHSNTVYYTTSTCLVLYYIIHTLYYTISMDCTMSQCWTSRENTLDLYFPIRPSLDNDYGTTRKAKLPWEH